jgi:type III secretory pathway lipoprotein EscJ
MSLILEYGGIMKKKIILLFLTLILVIFLFACDNNTDSELNNISANEISVN